MLPQVYKPYLLMNKKRYAGLLWTNSEKYDKMDTKVHTSAQLKSMHNLDLEHPYLSKRFMQAFTLEYPKLPSNIYWITRTYVRARPPDVVGKTSADWCRRRHTDVPAQRCDRQERRYIKGHMP